MSDVAQTGAAKTATYPPRPVDVDAIERELGVMWSEPPAGTSDSEEPVTRACMSNLIVLAPDAGESMRLTEEIEPIVQQHPSRVLLLVGEEDGPEDIAAHVSAVCHLGEGGRQVCSEHVSITARGEAARRRLPSAARPLILGDLPTALWWVGPEAPAVAGDLFLELAEMSHQVIFDSLAWHDPGRGLAATAIWAAGTEATAGISDLAWTRLAPWRSLVAQALAPAVAPGALDSLHRVEIEHGTRMAPQAWLLLGWLASQLGWSLAAGSGTAERRGEWQFTSRHGEVNAYAAVPAGGAADAFAVRLRFGSPDAPEELGVIQRGEGRLAIVGRGDAEQSAVMAPRHDRAVLVARELPDLGRDPVYRHALESARALVEKVLA